MKKRVLAALYTHKIRCGELGVQCGGKLLRETSHTASGHDGKEGLSKAPIVIPGDGGAPGEAAHRSRNAPLVSITPLAGKIAWMGFRRVGAVLRRSGSGHRGGGRNPLRHAPKLTARHTAIPGGHVHQHGKRH